jgi:hypothetical protein
MMDKTEVERQLQVIRESMPQTYAAIRRKVGEIGNDAYTLVRRGVRGEPNCFYALEAGYVVGTPFKANSRGSWTTFARYMVSFGVSFVIVWPRMQLPMAARACIPPSSKGRCMASRIEWVRMRLENWARWSAQRDSGGLGFPKQSAFVKLAAHGTRAEAIIPTDSVEASLTDDAVQALAAVALAPALDHLLHLSARPGRQGDVAALGQA